MKKTTHLNWFVSMVKLISWLVIPTLLCGFTVSFEAAFQTWALLLAFFIPSISGILISFFNNFWKKRMLALFFGAAVIGISFFTTSVVGMAMNVSSSRERLPLFITSIPGITIDSHATVWDQVFVSSAIVGMIAFVGVTFGTLLVQSVQPVMKEVIKLVIKNHVVKVQ